MVAIGSVSNFTREPKMEWEPKKYYFRTRQAVKIIHHAESMDMVIWCKENLRGVLIEARYRTDVLDYRWKAITDDYNFEDGWPYSTTRIWFKTEVDATAFKLRWEE